MMLWGKDPDSGERTFSIPAIFVAVVILVVMGLTLGPPTWHWIRDKYAASEREEQMRDAQKRQQDTVIYVGWVRNTNFEGHDTLIAFEKEGDITPFLMLINGLHPELWQNEYVRLTLLDKHEQYYGVEDFDQIDVQRLGPDRPTP